MKTKKRFMGAVALALAVLLVFPAFGGVNACAKTKKAAPKLSVTSLFITEKGKTYDISLKNAPKKSTIKWYVGEISDDKDNEPVKITKKSRTKARIEAVRSGSTELCCQVADELYKCDIDVCISNNSSYVKLCEYLYNAEKSDEDSYYLRNDASTIIAMYPGDHSIAFIWMKYDTDGVKSIVNGLDGNGGSLGISYLSASGAFGSYLKDSFSGDESDSDKAFDQLTESIDMDSVSDLDPGSIKKDYDLFRLIGLTAVTTQNFDPASYTKGARLSGFIGFVTDTDVSVSDQASAAAAAAFDDEDAALKAKFGFGLKELGYAAY
ncbi:MAG: hypothetical protein ACI4CS_10375 [Candidatus Weimeria sp.]